MSEGIIKKLYKTADMVKLFYMVDMLPSLIAHRWVGRQTL